MTSPDNAEWRLPSDVLILPVSRLQAGVRAGLDCGPDDYVVTRPTGRIRSLLIDRRGAAFLQEFRTPATIAGVVLRHAAATSVDPARLLDEVAPLVGRLLTLNLLVPGRVDATLAYRLAPGDELPGWTVTGRVQTLEDSEVYRVADSRGRHGAMKISRHRADPDVAATLAHEAAILRRLAGARVPAVLDLATTEEWPRLVVEWVPGDDGLVAASRARRADADILHLCATVADAYTDLHEHGVVHADVHPKNLLVAADGAVTLIDFGLARIVADGDGPPRQGVGYFFEPEYAVAALESRPLPPVTPEAEAYAVAALVYLLAAGEHYLDFPLRRRAFLQAIAHRSPEPFGARGVRDWPTVEAALGEALAKEPAFRLPCRQLANRLRAARSTPRGRTSSPVAADPWAGYRSIQAADGIPPRAPTSSVHYGSAGVAYAMLRVAQLDGDADALAAADAWLVAATRNGRRDAFENPLIGISDRSVGSNSLHHGPFGLAVLRGLIAHARWDPATTNDALHDAVAQARAGGERPDLVSGLAGILLGLAQLAEALPSDPLIDRLPLLAAGDQIGRELATRGPHPPAAQWTVGLPLGIAHGLGGSIYARLRWADAVRRLPPPDVELQLDALAGFAEGHDGGLRWPDRVGRHADASPFNAGWCNGSAGHALLFSQAARIYPSRGYGRIALGAARHAWQAADREPSVCCGLAGRSFALLVVAQVTSDRVWRQRAVEIAERITLPPDGPHAPEHSLYKGALGVHLLRRELDHGHLAAFPMFSTEGWASRDRVTPG